MEIMCRQSLPTANVSSVAVLQQGQQLGQKCSASTVSSIGKNLAVTQLRIAEKLNGIFRKTDRKSTLHINDI